eukprot:TRINITY_DN407_c0_g3_i2.p1 TRINITY_DN407_c0_g3~~TRINITY_DN407_c0_g3_i2.p1  ORF type:complete len:626 (+),score=175.51 TRINITY_DN407_c0_g3_i2:1385-3262(+)
MIGSLPPDPVVQVNGFFKKKVTLVAPSSPLPLFARSDCAPPRGGMRDRCKEDEAGRRERRTPPRAPPRDRHEAARGSGTADHRCPPCRGAPASRARTLVHRYLPPPPMRGCIPALLLAGAAAAAPPKPHVVFFLADDYGWNDIGYHQNQASSANPQGKQTTNGVIPTPTLDSLAAEAVKLENYYTEFLCSPTRGTIMTGRYASHTGIGPDVIRSDMPYGMPKKEVFWPELMKANGYKTHMVGKWHLGARADVQLPINRGVDHFFGILTGAAGHTDYVTSAAYYRTDLWENDGPAFGRDGKYSCHQWTEETVRVINAHDAQTPLFGFVSHQCPHSPYTAPAGYEDYEIDYPARRVFAAMSTCVHESTVNITDALKAKGMWETTLMIWSSDNGGPQYWQGNNWPLRGGKSTDFEGGVRTAAFAAGGLLAAALRGQELHTVMHISDVYTTFCSLAGLTAAEIEDNVPGLPGVDGLDLGDILTAAPENTTRPQAELVLSSNAYLDGDYKFIVYPYTLVERQGWCNYEHNVTGCGYWQSPHWPTSADHRPSTFDLLECNDGCLFHVANDPSERHDLSRAEPARFAAMKARHAELVKTAYQTDGDFGYTQCVTVAEYAAAHGGFGGPPCTK